MTNEFFGAIRIFIRRFNPCRRRFLSPQAQACGEIGFKHVVVAKVPFGNTGQRSVSKAAQELAADSPNHFAHFRCAGIISSLFRREGEARRAARRDTGHVSIHGGHR